MIIKSRASGVATTMAAIWADLLAIKSVSLNDDFFKLGGDSLTATTLTERLEEEFGVYLEPYQVFQAPKLSDFVDIVMAAMEQPMDEGVL